MLTLFTFTMVVSLSGETRIVITPDLLECVTAEKLLLSVMFDSGITGITVLVDVTVVTVFVGDNEVTVVVVVVVVVVAKVDLLGNEGADIANRLSIIP